MHTMIRTAHNRDLVVMWRGSLAAAAVAKGFQAVAVAAAADHLSHLSPVSAQTALEGWEANAGVRFVPSWPSSIT